MLDISCFGRFLPKKKSLVLKITAVISVIFITYQVVIFFQISRDPRETANSQLTTSRYSRLPFRGMHPKQLPFYIPFENNTFQCINSMETIAFTKINDDYCDCLDGTDEPGTSACPNGEFYCDNQKSFPKKIFSSRINDGICDCCDGSDEYSNRVSCINHCK